MIYDGFHLRVLCAWHELAYLAGLLGVKGGRTLGCVSVGFKQGCPVLVMHLDICLSRTEKARSVG